MISTADCLVGIVALEHLYILYIELFAWTTKGRRIFKGTLPDELFEHTKGIAANLGLYNGFLAAGLIWSYFVETPEWSTQIRIFFLGCIIVVALFGAFRSSPMILLKQGVPALLSIVAVLVNAYL